jgi:anti-sigma factor RsiW
MSPDARHADVEAYALGALEPGEAALFETHLAECAECRDDVASYAPVVDFLRSEDVPAPAPFPLRRLTPWRVRILRPASLAAAAVLALGLSYVGGLSHQSAEAAETAAVVRMVADPIHDLRADRGDKHFRVLVGAAREKTAVMVAGLTPLDAQHVYQVWIDDRSPGLLHRNDNGVDLLILHGDMVQGAHEIGVSEEPAGGSEHRTGPSLVSIDV